MRVSYQLHICQLLATISFGYIREGFEEEYSTKSGITELSAQFGHYMIAC